MPAQRHQLRQQVLRRPAHPLRLQHLHPGAERQHRRLQLLPPRLVGDDDARRGHRGQRHREALHRARDVDDRHTARRCAVQVRVTMSSAPGRRDVLGDHASSVRSRSRSPSSPRDRPEPSGAPRLARARPGRAGGTPARPAVERRPAARRRWPRPCPPASRRRPPGPGDAPRRTPPRPAHRPRARPRRTPGAAGRAAGGRGCAAPGRVRARVGAGSPAGATRRAVGFSLGVRALRRGSGVGGPEPVEQLVDHRLGRAVDTVGHADAAGERGVGGVAGGVAAGVRLAAQLGQAGQHQCEVDRPAHRRAHPHVAVLAGGPGQRRPRSRPSARSAR